MKKMISKITGIHEGVLGQDVGQFRESLDAYSIAQRMSWASKRETTRVEDMAYSLLGIFGVNMPLLYGEGEKAFVRLQEEIIKRSDDQSILAWGLNPSLVPARRRSLRKVGPKPGLTRRSLFARSPRRFSGCSDIQRGTQTTFATVMTSLGMQIELPLVVMCGFNSANKEVIDGCIGLLGCRLNTPTLLIGIVLVPVTEHRVASATDSNITTSTIFSRGTLRKYSLFQETVLVGVDLAAQAVTRRITIAHDAKKMVTKRDALCVPRLHQYVVTLSSALHDIGYQLSKRPSTKIFCDALIPRESPASWDATSRVLTVEDEFYSRSFMGFMFESTNQLQENFSVFLSGEKSVARKGTSFSAKRQFGFYDFLQNGTTLKDPNDVELEKVDGTRFKIQVGINTKDVCHWRIHDVQIDLVWC